MSTETKETICFYGYPDKSTDDVRLDEYTRMEVEDIMRIACVALGGVFDPEWFDKYWRDALARKSQWRAN